jgi:hypothetical protein
VNPLYSQSESKSRARAENIRLYRRLTGLRAIPADRGYWTLCNSQPKTKGSEIVQMVRSGLITEQQFFGVDWDKAIIDQNREWHPEAKWFAGDWLDVIESQKKFLPGLIYLDSTAFADHHHSTQMTVHTMMRCPVGTVLIVNVMMNDPRSSRPGFTGNVLMTEISRQVPLSELKRWDQEIPVYEYGTTRYTKMGSFVFFKRR